MDESLSLEKRLLTIGISRPYASQISRGMRQPSLDLALRIYRELGEQLGPLAVLSKREIAVLEKISSRDVVA